jgi:hypothetical protein
MVFYSFFYTIKPEFNRKMIMNANNRSEQTTDSFDTHIVPAETRARKEREGGNYKHTPDNAEDPASIHTADGFTVDTEGLINNYAVEPTMYAEDGGEINPNAGTLVEKFTIVDVFASHLEVENAVTEIHNAGISRDKISILGKNYQDTEHGNGSLSWQKIEADGGLAQCLVQMGIDRIDANKYEMEVEVGKTLVIVIGKNEDVIKTKQILVGIGHRLSKNQVEV